MKVTILATALLMLSYFLILYSAVALIQDKKLFKSAPTIVQNAILPKKERFRGAHTIGWTLMVFATIWFAASFVLNGYNCVINRIGFYQSFVSFIVMLYGMELFDIFIFDWVLLCHSNFYPHFFPEVKNLVGPKLFGFNKKTHIIHLITYIPVSAALALICMKFID